MCKDLFQFAVERLAETKGSWPETASTCGVSYSWLVKFAKGEIPDASYRKVHRIAMYLGAGKRGPDRRKTERRTH